MGAQVNRSHVRAPVRSSNSSAYCETPQGSAEQVQAVVRATCWEPRQDLDIAEWICQGQRLGSIGRGVAWWIGDWVNYGNTKFGEKYSRAARITGYDVQSLMNMAYVASRFDNSRRREHLSWSHHAELAGLEASQQENWLDRAEKTTLSVRGLRDELRTWRSRLRSFEADGTDQQEPSTGHADDAMVCPQCGYSMTPKDDLCF